MKAKFTLIELIVVIAVLGILAAIVIPNISQIQDKATIVALQSDLRNLQTGSDMFALENNGNLPSKQEPEVGFPEPLDMTKLKPDYIRNTSKNKDIHFWVDFQGKVWASKIDSPQDVHFAGTKLDWSDEEGAVSYKVYEITNGTSSAVKATKLKFVEEVYTSEFQTVQDKEYAVSSVDENGFETPPAKKSYGGYEEPVDQEGHETVNQKPIAVITMTPSTKIFPDTVVTWSYASSTDPDLDAIDKAEWELDGVLVSNPNGVISQVGDHSMRLRVQDNKGLWSDWTSSTFTVKDKEIVADDFETLDRSIWTVEEKDSCTTISAVSGQLKIENIKGCGWTSGNILLPDSFKKEGTITFEYDWTPGSVYSGSHGHGLSIFNQDTISREQSYYGEIDRNAVETIFCWSDGTNLTGGAFVTYDNAKNRTGTTYNMYITAGVKHKIKIIIDSNNRSYKTYVDGNLFINTIIPQNIWDGLGTNLNVNIMKANYNTNSVDYFDNVKITVQK